MHATIRVSGPAGLGINSLAEMIGRVTASLGYFVVSDIEYESRIKGGTNWFDLNVSERDHSIRKTVDVLIPFDAAAVEKSIGSVRENGVIILNAKHVEKLSEATRAIIASRNIALATISIEHKYENSSLLGAFLMLSGVDAEHGEREIMKTFAAKTEAMEENLSQFRSAFELGVNILGAQPEAIRGVYDRLSKLSRVSEPKTVFFNGNRLIAEGAIDTELEFYSAYPMTPASSILTDVAGSGKVPCLQAEDEIAVINAALGAGFTGARSMVGTSGGGFALMTEALSFAAQAEIPVVVALSQRAGPSTGTPTYYEQGDIAYALRPTFGEFGHVVLCPSTFEEGYVLAGEALNIAQVYQTTVILLIDKQFSENFVALESLPSSPTVRRGKLLETPSADYKRYEITPDGISPYVRVGTVDGDFIATSYEHDEYGASSEDSANKVAMTEKRARKLANFFEDEGVFGYEHINPTAKKCIVTLGFTRYVAEDFVRDHSEYSLVVITHLLPLDTRIRSILEEKEEIIFVESNHSGQLEHHVVTTLGLSDAARSRVKNFRKYDLFPFYLEDFEEKFS